MAAVATPAMPAAATQALAVAATMAAAVTMAAVAAVIPAAAAILAAAAAAIPPADCFRCSPRGSPRRAGTDSAAGRLVAQWVPASAGTRSKGGGNGGFFQ